MTRAAFFVLSGRLLSLIMDVGSYKKNSTRRFFVVSNLDVSEKMCNFAAYFRKMCFHP